MADTSTPESPWAVFKADLETLTPVDTILTGTIPEWLRGTLFRNGCGFFHEDTKMTTHLFEGYGVLHRYDISEGVVKYTSRILHRDAWLRSLKATRTALAEDGSTREFVDPCMDTFAGSATHFQKEAPESRNEAGDEDGEDRTGVNVVRHGDRLLALTESPVLQEVDPQSLKLQGKVDLTKVFSVHMATAHPHFGADGSMYNLATAFPPPNNYNIIKIPPRAFQIGEEDAYHHMKLVASVQSRWPMGISYSHSFGMTERYFVLLEQPATLNAARIVGQASKGGFHPSQVFRNFDLHPKEKIRFYLISRRQGNKVLSTQYYAPPCFTFHFVNCYDDGDYVVVDLCSYDNLNIINELIVGSVAGSTEDIVTATIRRYVLPLSVDKAPLNHNLRTLPYTTARARVTSPGVVHLTPDFICKPQDKLYIELPRINYELCAGKKYRYVYGTAMLTSAHRLIKLDLETRTPLYWAQEGCDPGEPVFVPRPGATEEDDGVVLSPVVGLGGGPCFLLLLDARSFREVGRASTPGSVRIAPSFHGNFLPPTDHKP